MAARSDSASASSSAASWPDSSPAISTIASRSSMRSARDSTRLRSAWAWDRAEVTTWAASGSSQRLGAEACSDSSAIRPRSACGSVTAAMEA